MWNYEKRLEYPIKIKQTNPTLAAMIISQYGGPDGELGASMRYISQRYSMPYREVAGLLTDIGTEELGHFEMISTMVHQLTRNLTMEQGEITASPYVSPDPHTATDNLKDHIVSRWNLLIASDDFHAVLSLAESLYRHTTHILSFLPNTEVTSRGNADRDALVDSMEEEFTRASFLQKAGEMGIKSETASTWLKRMQKHGLVENVDGKGNYRKPKV